MVTFPIAKFDRCRHLNMNQPNWATYIGEDRHEGIYEPGKEKRKNKAWIDNLQKLHFSYGNYIQMTLTWDKEFNEN